MLTQEDIKDLESIIDKAIEEMCIVNSYFSCDVYLQTLIENFVKNEMKHDKIYKITIVEV